MLLNDLKKAALCVAAGFAVSMLGGCDSQKSAGAPAELPLSGLLRFPLRKSSRPSWT